MVRMVVGVGVVLVGCNLKERTYLKRYRVMSVEGQQFNSDDEVKGRREDMIWILNMASSAWGSKALRAISRLSRCCM
jgi:hypothetical protein